MLEEIMWFAFLEDSNSNGGWQRLYLISEEWLFEGYCAIVSLEDHNIKE